MNEPETIESEVTEVTDDVPQEEDQESQTPDGFVKADDAQKDINKQHKKFRDEERAHVKTKAATDKLKQELDELRANSVDLTIPPIPDQYAENYQELIKSRDEAIQRVTQHESDTARLEQDTVRAKEQAETDKLEATQQKVQGFESNIIQLGLNPVEVKKAADIMVDSGITEALENIVLEDPEGPLLVSYLASNPVELDKANGMTFYQLTQYLSEIRPQALLLKPQTSNAPDPPVILKGGGAPEMEDPLLKGVIFE